MTTRRALFCPLLAAIFALAPIAADAQNIYTGTRATARFELSTRWTTRADIGIGYGYTAEPYNALGGGLGAGFHLNRNATLAGYCSLAHANFRDITNKELILRLNESISWRRPSGFFFGFFFEQRRLIYHPSDYKINTSCFGGLAGYEHRWERSGLMARGFVTVVANTKSENSSASFLQRVKGSLAIRKTVGSIVAIGADYTFAIGGPNQIYIADRNKLNTINVAIDIFLPSTHDTQ